MMASRILVVDDEPAVRRAIEKLLRASGYDVRTAAHGEEACEVLARHDVDVILIDLRMPGMSGATLFHVIVTQWPQYYGRVAVMSGDHDAEETEPWLRINRLPVVLKPFQMDEVLAVIQHILPSRERHANGS